MEEALTSETAASAAAVAVPAAQERMKSKVVLKKGLEMEESPAQIDLSLAVVREVG